MKLAVRSLLPGRREFSRRVGGRFSLCALLALLAAAPTWATLVPTMSVEEMIDDSEIVVHGKVWRTWAAWDEGHQNI